MPRLQRVLGVDFSYQPPPRSVVPCAAALKGQSTPADHHQAHHGHVPPPHHAHAHGPRGPPGMDRGALHMGGSRGRYAEGSREPARRAGELVAIVHVGGWWGFGCKWCWLCPG